MKALLIGREWRGRRYLASPVLDFLLAGGISLVLIPLLFVVVPLDANGMVDAHTTYAVSVTFAALAYVVNYPHFMASYLMLYGGYRTRLNAHRGAPIYWRYLGAGVVVPAALIAYLVYAFIRQDDAVFAFGVHLLFFTVGWHYVKQAFGVFIMLSALKSIYYSPRVRQLLLVNSLLVWVLSWLRGNIWVPGLEKTESQMHGVRFTTLDLGIPPYLMELLEAAVVVYGIAAALAIALVAWRSRTRPSFSALAGYGSMYALLLLAYYHPLWAYMTPLWHSAQYLLFVVAYKRGELAQKAAESKMPRRARMFWALRFAGVCLLLGVLGFQWAPASLEWLSGHVVFAVGISLPFMYAFDIFINVHHYFIDNVIWRKENRNVGEYLFAR